MASRHGGLGLRSAVRHAPAASWASWADTLPILLKRDRPFALHFADLSRASKQQKSCQSCCHCKLPATLCPPLALNSRPGTACSMEKIRVEPQLDNTRGWQRAASQPVDGLLRELDAAFADLLDSQQDRTRPAFSLHGPPWNPCCSELSCCVGSAWHSRSLQRYACFASPLMPSEITLLLAHGLVCCAPVGADLSERLPQYATRRALLSRCMSLCVISMWISAEGGR